MQENAKRKILVAGMGTSPAVLTNAGGRLILSHVFYTKLE